MGRFHLSYTPILTAVLLFFVLPLILILLLLVLSYYYFYYFLSPKVLELTKFIESAPSYNVETLSDLTPDLSMCYAPSASGAGSSSGSSNSSNKSDDNKGVKGGSEEEKKETDGIGGEGKGANEQKGEGEERKVREGERHGTSEFKLKDPFGDAPVPNCVVPTNAKVVSLMKWLRNELNDAACMLVS